MAHLPPSYEGRCPRTWFATPAVQVLRCQSPAFLFATEKSSGTCGCKCGAIEGVAGAAQSRNKTRQESDAIGSDGSENLRMD
jgi:hypothetical protein